MIKIIKYALKTIPNITRFIHWNNKTYRHRDEISRILKYSKFREFVIKENHKLKFNITLYGEENIPVDSSYLVVSNHQALIDPMIYTEIFKDPLTFVGKSQIENYPIFRKLLPNLEGKFLERDNLRQEIKVMKEIQESLKKDNLRWLIFPEGTRNKTSDHILLDFKPGTFKYPMQIQKKILGCAIFGTHYALDDKIKQKINHIEVHILPPLTFEEYKDLSTQDVARIMQERIQEKVNEAYQNHLLRVKGA